MTSDDEWMDYPMKHTPSLWIDSFPVCAHKKLLAVPSSKSSMIVFKFESWSIHTWTVQYQRYQVINLYTIQIYFDACTTPNFPKIFWVQVHSTGHFDFHLLYLMLYDNSSLGRIQLEKRHSMAISVAFSISSWLKKRSKTQRGKLFDGKLENLETCNGSFKVLSNNTPGPW